MCDMCGSEEKLFRTDIEGSVLNVCSSCAKFGKIIAAVPEVIRQKQKRPEAKPDATPSKSELIQIVSDDAAQKVREKRQRLGLKQKQLAKAIAEKESLIQKIESGQFIPSISLARKLERYLKIRIVEQHEEKHDHAFRAKGSSLTIGDMLSTRK